MVKENSKLIISSNEEIPINIFNSFCEKVFEEIDKISSWFDINDYPPLKLTLASKLHFDDIVKRKKQYYK